MSDISSNEIVNLTATPLSVEDQIKKNEERRQQWYQDKADILLASDNKKELIVGLITDFNNILGCTKEIERLVKDALADKSNSSLKMKLCLRQILKMFAQHPEAEEVVDKGVVVE